MSEDIGPTCSDVPAIECKNVGCRFERWGQIVHALQGIDISIKSGEWVMLVGVNGSGKSTLLRVIANQQPIDSGEVRLFGQSIASLGWKAVSRVVFYVHQNPLIGSAADLTVFENLWIADSDAERRRLSRRSVRTYYAELLAGARLEDRLDQRVDTLSGGQRQFLTLVIAELRAVPVILLDEPFAALDEANGLICLHKLREMHAKRRTLVHVTHDLRHLTEGSQRIIRIHAGHIVDHDITTDVQQVCDSVPAQG